MSTSGRVYAYIGAYLVAIVIANLAITYVMTVLGDGATGTLAFLVVDMVVTVLCIGLDLASRDSLHEAWHGRGLWWRMGALIGAGSALSWLMARFAAPILFGLGQAQDPVAAAIGARVALASFAAFASANLVDAGVYHALIKRGRWVKLNGSNTVCAIVDSLVFTTLAAGGFSAVLVVGEFLAKVVGGALWSMLIVPKERRGTAVAAETAQ